MNLQRGHLMVNYDLPWNPNRLEQRFGRIHRIGQPEVCHLWNLVAKETREGAVYHRLLEKLRTESDALKGRVFDVLGEVFEGTSLKALLLEAIQYGDRADVRAKLTTKVDAAFDHGHVVALLDRNALAQETFTPDRLFAVKEQMDRAEARRLQPFFVRAFFLKAFDHLGGVIHRRPAGRFEITRVPPDVVDRGRRLAGRNRRESEPVLKKYQAVAFTKEAVQPLDRPGLTRAALLHPGHPLMLAVSDLLLEKHADLLRRGTIFLDPADDGGEPSLLVLLSHDVKAGDGTVLSQRVQFVRVAPDGRTAFAGWAPHLDLEPLAPADRARLETLLVSPWLSDGLEGRAVAHAAAELAPDHYKEVADRRVAHADKTLRAVHERLTQEIKFQTDRWLKLKDDLAAGKDVKLPMDNARRTAEDLQARLDARTAELKAMRHVVNGTPAALGAALVVPAGLVRQLRGDGPALTAADADARKRVEDLAMKCVIAAEEAAGCRVVDVSADKCGWDLTSHPPAVNGVQPEARHIEVKGRVAGADTICATRNEILYALNQAGKFLLAIVFVRDDDGCDGPLYIRQPFDTEPGWGSVSVTYSIPALLTKAHTDGRLPGARAEEAH